MSVSSSSSSSRFSLTGGTAEGASTYCAMAKEKNVPEATPAIQKIPSTSQVCETLLAVEKLAGAATRARDELATLAGQLDVLAKGVLDRCEESSESNKRLQKAFRGLLNRALAVAALCGKWQSASKYRRLVLGNRITRDLSSVKTNASSFASSNELPLTQEQYVS